MCGGVEVKVKVKVKCTLVQALGLCTAHRVSRGILLLFLDHGTRRGWVVSSTPRLPFTPGKDPVPIVQEAGWAPGPVWTGTVSLTPTGIPSPDRPAHSQSLYRLSYPAHSWSKAALIFKLNPTWGQIVNCTLGHFTYRNINPVSEGQETGWDTEPFGQGGQDRNYYVSSIWRAGDWMRRRAIWTGWPRQKLLCLQYLKGRRLDEMQSHLDRVAKTEITMPPVSEGQETGWDTEPFWILVPCIWFN